MVDAVSEAPVSSPESVQIVSVLSVPGCERASIWTDYRIDSARAECSGTADGEATEKSIVLETSGVEGVYASTLEHLRGGGGVQNCVASLCGVGLKGYSGCEWSPTDARRSASLLPSTVTCEGALIQTSSRSFLSSSSSTSSQMGTLLTGPHEPTHPLTFQRLAAPRTHVVGGGGRGAGAQRP